MTQSGGSDIRPAGSGRPAIATSFLRSIASPRAGLVITLQAALPADWPTADGSIEANLGHALGWTCEVRKHDVVVVNPLGEGLAKAPVPELSSSWLDNARHDGSCAMFLAPSATESGFAELTIASAASAGDLRAATIRTAVADDYGAMEPVGRNQPCPCGSGKKYKHCHGGS